MRKSSTVLFLFAFSPMLMLFFSWYVGIFAKPKSFTYTINEEKKFLVKTFRGDYLNASLVINPLQNEFLKNGKPCYPIILLLESEKETLKYQMQNKAGCLCVKACPELKESEVFILPTGTYEALEIKAHPVFALRKFFAYFKKFPQKFKFPVAMEYDGEKKTHLFYSVSMQK